MAITPCESWPARLALTQPTATAPASSSDAPAAFKSAAPMRVRRSAWTIGMGFPQTTARVRGGSCLFAGAWSQSRLPIAITPRPILVCKFMGAMQRRHLPAAGRPIRGQSVVSRVLAFGCWHAVYFESQFADAHNDHLGVLSA